MFFKNIFVFAFTRPFTTAGLELNEAMQQHTFTPCGSTELRHFGWGESLGKGSLLVTESSGSILICARSEDKILPAPVIKDAVDLRIEEFEIIEGRTPSKKERKQIKEDVVFQLLPRAFSRITDTHAYINTEENIIVVNASSRGKAEDVLSLLRKTLGTLPVTSINPKIDPAETMTDWVRYDCMDDKRGIDTIFTLGCEASFMSCGVGAIATVKKQDLDGAEVESHLDAGKYVTKIALEYENSMSLIIHDDLSIKRIKFFDVIAEQNDDIDSEDIQSKSIADFTLMAGELNRMIRGLHSEFNVKASDYLEA